MQAAGQTFQHMLPEVCWDAEVALASQTLPCRFSWMAVSEIKFGTSWYRHAGRGILNFDDPDPGGGACIVSGESKATAQDLGEITTETKNVRTSPAHGAALDAAV